MRHQGAWHDLGMKPALQIRLNQQLALTPQLQQAIRLLQLSSMELELELNTAIESNPLLELEDDRPEAESDTPETVDGVETAPESASESSRNGDRARRRPARSGARTQRIPRHRARRGRPRAAGRRSRGPARSPALAAEPDADVGARPRDRGHDHRRRSTTTAISASPTSRSRRSLASLLHDHRRRKSKSVRHRVQHFDPVGVASRTLRECLDVQLDTLDASTPGACARAHDRQRASRSARAAGSQPSLPAPARDRRGIRDRGRADPLARAQTRRRLFEHDRRIRRAGCVRAQGRRALARRARAGLPAAPGHQRALRGPDRKGAPRRCARTCAASCRKRAG